MAHDSEISPTEEISPRIRPSGSKNRLSDFRYSDLVHPRKPAPHLGHEAFRTVKNKILDKHERDRH